MRKRGRLEDWLQAVQLVLICEQVSHYEPQVWQVWFTSTNILAEGQELRQVELEKKVKDGQLVQVVVWF